MPGFSWNQSFNHNLLYTLANKATVLHEIDLTIRNNTYCQEVMDNLAIFSVEKDEFHSNGLFCAGGEKGKDACEGDSGSAIFTKQKRKVIQLGLVSGTPGNEDCGADGVPTFYTRVQYYLKWILDNIME